MIQPITSVGECLDFMGTFYEDPQFSDPMLSDKEQFQRNFARAMEKPETHSTWGIFRDGKMIGLFTFLVLPEEKYLEMLVGLCRDREGYREIFEYLEGHYAGYDADFVFNPENYLLKSALQKREAEFEPEQQKMVLEIPVPGEDTSGVEAYTPSMPGSILPSTIRICTGQGRRWRRQPSGFAPTLPCMRVKWWATWTLPAALQKMRFMTCWCCRNTGAWAMAESCWQRPCRKTTQRA